MRRRVPPKSLGGREEVSLSPRAVLAPDLPPSVLWNRRSLQSSFVHHLPDCSIFAAFHTRSYTGYVPVMLSMKIVKVLLKGENLSFLLTLTKRAKNERTKRNFIKNILPAVSALAECCHGHGLGLHPLLRLSLLLSCPDNTWHKIGRAHV